LKIQWKPWHKAAAGLALLLIAFGAGFFTKTWTTGSDEKLVAEAFRVIANDSIDSPINRQELAYSAIRGMIAKIDDPYAELIEPEAAKNFTNTFAGKTGVVGLYAENIDGKMVVSIVFPGGAASAAGLQAGDVLTAIDGETLDAATDSSEAGLRMRGEPGSHLQLTVLRGAETLTFDLVRQVRVYVTSRMLPDGIAYLSLSAYNRTAVQQTKDALTALLAQNPRALVWDLRNNEGGDMLAAQEILSFFIKDGLLFSAELTHERKVAFYTKGKVLAGDLPMMVLIDHTTYSAAETSAAAISARGRGQTVGSTTYGKGVIQATITLPEGALLQMTVARWYSPDGEWYHHRGVPPQVEAPDNPATAEDETLQKAIELLSR
jgi:carboxyl-terminal processing protease